MLPSTGWDDQYNTGRGYVQSRFRGRQMKYFETEYRYRITRNGLIGGVVFFNVENFSGNPRPYDTFLPGYGAGVRIKLNKKSNANLCLDYGIGKGSSGFYVNLGEVF
jgi:hemolysin activation/secretion protein